MCFFSGKIQNAFKQSNADFNGADTDGFFQTIINGQHGFLTTHMGYQHLNNPDGLSTLWTQV